MHELNVKSAQSKRRLTKEEEIEIAAWCRQNPETPLTNQIKIWMKKFNCSAMSINQVMVKMGMGII